jgi:hypothetical protein
MSGYSIEFLLIAVFLTSRVKTTPKPVAGFDSAVATYQPVFLFPIGRAKLFREAHADGCLRSCSLRISL